MSWIDVVSLAAIGLPPLIAVWLYHRIVGRLRDRARDRFERERLVGTINPNGPT